MGEFIAIIRQSVAYSAANLEKQGYRVIGMVDINGELHYVAVKKVTPRLKKGV